MREPAQVPLWIDLAAVAFGAMQGAAAFVALDTVGAAPRIAAGACLAVVFAVRMLALARGWQSPAPVIGARRSA